MSVTVKEEPSSYYVFLKELQTLLHHSGITQTTAGLNYNKESQPEEKSLESNPAVGRVVIYIEEHLTEQLSLEKLAEEVRLSKYQLIRKFQSEMGHTPWQYVLDKRLERAREMLEEGLPLAQIAVNTGFYDQSHFHRKFKEETGLTPKEYQEKNSSSNRK